MVFTIHQENLKGIQIRIEAKAHAIINLILWIIKVKFPYATFVVSSITGQIIVQILFENDLHYMVMMILRRLPFFENSIESFVSETFDLIWHCFSLVTLKQFAVKCRFNIIRCYSDMMILRILASKKYKYGHLGCWCNKSTLYERLLNWNKIFEKIKYVIMECIIELN